MLDLEAQRLDRGGAAVWGVGALLHAISDALAARFNPVAVEGEISGFARAASGHCYFTLKDDQGQLRCALFRRAASLLDFAPRDGQRVLVRGRLAVYEPRGELQMVAESLQLAGQGKLFERFLQLKAQLAAEGLFDAARKRALPLMPRALGVVTSLGAAALHDVLTALRRRVPHIPVVVYPASVQGANAAAELQAALRVAYARVEVDALLLVRGGGALEDLWSFNDEGLARLIVRSPMPVVCGVGHETDFTIADFCADVRAPTPTAAAELAAQPRQVWLGALDLLQERLQQGLDHQLQTAQQRLDLAASRLGQPSHRLTRERAGLQLQRQRLAHATALALQRHGLDLQRRAQAWQQARVQALALQQRRIEQIALRLAPLDPHQVLERGYAWLADAQGHPLTRAAQVRPGQPVMATLADGQVELQATARR